MEDHRWLPQDAIPRSPEDAARRLLRRRRLQPAPHGQADRCDMSAGVAVARDARRRAPEHNPQLPSAARNTAALMGFSTSC